jgi:hypothetical protein
MKNPTNILKGLVKDILFRKMLRNIKVEQLLTNKKGDDSRTGFCIVHWNAPKFLLLNIKRLELLHPECRIYVFDNASSNENLEAVLNGLKHYENVTLFSNKHDYSRTWACHIIGLQFLLNYAAKKSDHTVIFLDQDCILARRIDDLMDKLDGKNISLIGVRYGDFDAVHASFMMMQPVVIYRMFGDCSLMDGFCLEPYLGISRKFKGKILFLEKRAHNEIPLLTSYEWQDKIYAWHAWFSSRTVGMKETDVLDGLPVWWIRNAVEKAYNFMENLQPK